MNSHVQNSPGWCNQHNAAGCGENHYQEHFKRRDALPGVVASIPTFGSALNFNPDVHALVTEGVLEHGGAFLPLTAPDLAALNELFRRLVLAPLPIMRAGCIVQPTWRKVGRPGGRT